MAHPKCDGKEVLNAPCFSLGHVRIEYVPEERRERIEAQHGRAGIPSLDYPDNGARRTWLCRDCLGSLLENEYEAPWAKVLTDG